MYEYFVPYSYYCHMWQLNPQSVPHEPPPHPKKPATVGVAFLKTALTASERYDLLRTSVR